MRLFASIAALPFSVGISAALFFATGCSSFRTDMGHPLSGSVQNYTNGQTHLQTVLDNMGPPNAATKLPDGFAFLYEYTRINEFQLGISVNVSVLRYFKFLHAWNSLEREVMLVTFDKQGTVRNATMRTWKGSLGGGSAVQVIVNVMSLSDVAQFLQPADANNWGDRLLQPLPTTLNSAQSLRTGEHGLQLRGPPEFVGQETLEMSVPKTERTKKKIKRNYQQTLPLR
jgi:hypothetical protein